MKAFATEIEGVMLLEPAVFRDGRGFFVESWNERTFAALGIANRFVQDNHSRSTRGVLRGLHYQVRQPQGKLIRVTRGEIFDVAVDVRRGSPTFGRHVARRLDDRSMHMLWVPEGFAHGFLVLSEVAEVQYKATDFYAPVHERSLLWDDPALGIEWPLEGRPVLSEKDRAGQPLASAELPA